jgi:PIN domain nuclease of toxin-antitoxin system
MGLPQVILLDTHVVIWLADESNRISSAATKAIQDARADAGLMISSVTLFEIAYLTQRGRISIDSSIEVFLEAIEQRLVIKPITVPVAIAATRFSDPYPRDPMDRLIGATAFIEGIPLVTADERIRRAGQLQTIW